MAVVQERGHGEGYECPTECGDSLKELSVVKAIKVWKIFLPGSDQDGSCPEETFHFVTLWGFGIYLEVQKKTKQNQQPKHHQNPHLQKPSIELECSSARRVTFYSNSLSWTACHGDHTSSSFNKAIASIRTSCKASDYFLQSWHIKWCGASRRVEC